MEDTQDFLNKTCAKIMENRLKTIDLFCETFLCVQSPLSIEDLKHLFTLVELECNIDGLKETYRLKLKEDPKRIFK